MAHVGKTATVHYQGSFDNGSVFDSSAGRDPLKFVIGAGQVVIGFDRAVQSMEVGETKTFRIPRVEAYGERDPQRVMSMPRGQLPANINPVKGLRLEMSTPRGPLPVVVSDTSPEKVWLDANHPLAGKDLTFEITLVAIADA